MPAPVTSYKSLESYKLQVTSIPARWSLEPSLSNTLVAQPCHKLQATSFTKTTRDRHPHVTRDQLWSQDTGTLPRCKIARAGAHRRRPKRELPDARLNVSKGAFAATLRSLDSV